MHVNHLVMELLDIHLLVVDEAHCCRGLFFWSGACLPALHSFVEIEGGVSHILLHLCQRVVVFGFRVAPQYTGPSPLLLYLPLRVNFMNRRGLGTSRSNHHCFGLIACQDLTLPIKNEQCT